MKKGIYFLLIFISSFAQAQELNCQVTVLTDAALEVSTVQLEELDQLKQTVMELMNGTKWTKDKFEVEERINCNLQFQISKIPSPGVYEGSLQIQSSRPAFNSSYNTTLLNHKDANLNFSYSRNAMLMYAENQFRDNLTSIVAYYAYFILGMDYDSFGKSGGTPYFTECQKIVTLAQSSGSLGWNSNDNTKRNRYWLVDNILSPQFEGFRECNYSYHREGLDKLYENKVDGTKKLYDALSKLTNVNSSRPNSINVQIFVQAKLNELKGLYSDVDVKDKNELVNLLKRLDPVNSSKYQEILN